ncbi:MAG: UxaA family hydrolase [Desulfitobacterium sp.]|nr:UxaA family hydrolase [Desulfitobacterium sp.]
MEKQAVVIHEIDNVATCVKDVSAGTTISFYRGNQVESLLLQENIPLGHKVAILPIAKGEEVVKYAESIGKAIKDIQPGQHVHVHNMVSKRGRGDLEN